MMDVEDREESAYTNTQCAEILPVCRLGVYVASTREADRWSSRLSGGEQQRVAFARMLLANSSTICLVPFSGTAVRIVRDAMTTSAFK